MPKRVDTKTGEVMDDPTVTLKDGDGNTLLGPMPTSEFNKLADKMAAKDAFALEPSEPGKVPDRVIEELRVARHNAKEYATAFNDSCKAQAEKYNIKPGALKRYVVALEEDKLEELDAETDDLERLIGSAE